MVKQRAERPLNLTEGIKTLQWVITPWPGKLLCSKVTLSHLRTTRINKRYPNWNTYPGIRDAPKEKSDTPGMMKRTHSKLNVLWAGRKYHIRILKWLSKWAKTQREFPTAWKEYQHQLNSEVSNTSWISLMTVSSQKLGNDCCLGCSLRSLWSGSKFYGCPHVRKSHPSCSPLTVSEYLHNNLLSSHRVWQAVSKSRLQIFARTFFSFGWKRASNLTHTGVSLCWAQPENANILHLAAKKKENWFFWSHPERFHQRFSAKSCRIYTPP